MSEQKAFRVFYSHTETGEVYVVKVSPTDEIIASAGPVKFPLKGLDKYEYTPDRNDWIREQIDKRVLELGLANAKWRGRKGQKPAKMRMSSVVYDGQAPPPEYDTLVLDSNVPCKSPYPETRHRRLFHTESFKAVESISKVVGKPLEDWPFPEKQTAEELKKFKDQDLARLVLNVRSACVVFDRMVSQPLSEELLRYYAYVPLPCQVQLLRFYRFEVVRAPFGRAQTSEEEITKMHEESQDASLREISWCAGERLMNLIITDLSCRSSTLGKQIERTCQAIVQKAVENDAYFARLRAYTPQYWNERNYGGPIRSLKARLVTLLEQLNHVGQILDKELKGEVADPKGKVGKKTQKKRPTKAEMANRNKAVAMAAAKFKDEHDCLPSVDDIMGETKYTREEIYETGAYADGKIARRSAKAATGTTGASVAESEQFDRASEQHSRVNRRSKAEQDELDKLIDNQKEDDSSAFVR